jgi:hypothetical protein
MTYRAIAVMEDRRYAAIEIGSIKHLLQMLKFVLVVVALLYLGRSHPRSRLRIAALASAEKSQRWTVRSTNKL